MARRVEGKAAIVVGGGQTPGQTIGNGRATAIVLAREGARVVVADRVHKSAQETVDLIRGEGGEAWAVEAEDFVVKNAEDVIDVCIERLEGFQQGPFACRENNVAITKFRGAKIALLERTAQRQAQGVEGTMQPHADASPPEAQAP